VAQKPPRSQAGDAILTGSRPFPALINDGVVQGIRDRDARLAEERIQAEAAQIRVEERRKTAQRMARAGFSQARTTGR
jgi:hypothetical protein